MPEIIIRNDQKYTKEIVKSGVYKITNFHPVLNLEERKTREQKVQRAMFDLYDSICSVEKHNFDTSDA